MTTSTAPARRTTIDRLILNPPFAEPAKHWKYYRETRDFELVHERRVAGYVQATPGAKSFDDPGVFVEMPLVNLIRARVKAWRNDGYPGMNIPARELMEHWTGDNGEPRDQRFFFCQLEAIETLIWLEEAPASERAGIVVPGDGGAFSRVCTKLATGAGKTVVMAMLIAWQVCSRMLLSNTKRYARSVLVMAPGLTVRNRLGVLHPDHPDNYYRRFDIVPAWLWERFRKEVRVEVRNWQSLGWEDEAKLAKKRSVDKRGAKSDEAWAREKLGALADERNLLVVNDEAHHAWRVPPGVKLKGVDKDEVAKATLWVAALDRVHRARGVRSAYDFSATPFVPGGSKSNEEALFAWVVSDFGLNDAIESGLVKTPRVVVRDDAMPNAQSYKSRLYHLYADADVKADLTRPAAPHEPLPSLVSTAYLLLGADWKATRDTWEKGGSKVPPVMITVANRTETAARVKYAFDEGAIAVPELCDRTRTLHIDSDVLEKAEAREAPVVIDGAVEAEDEAEEGDDEEEGVEKVSKQVKELRRAEYLRKQVDTVGAVGEPGQDIQHVIAVQMLSEGWDAKTVTHIMGLRAFGSQLLCEQVVGRGLRRTSYEVDEATGLYRAEYVNIFGVPFTFLPHEGAGEDGEVKPEAPKTRIESLPERSAYEIRWPRVARIERRTGHTLTLDLNAVEPLVIRAANFPMTAELAPVLDGKAFDQLATLDLQKIAEEFRLQRQIFYVAKKLYEKMAPDWEGAPVLLVAQLVPLVERFIASQRLVFQPESLGEHDLRRRVLLLLSAGRIVEHLWTAIRQENTEALDIVLDTERPMGSTAEMPAWYSSKPCAPTKRSQVNFSVFDSAWEATEAYVLEHSAAVVSWVKNDHLPFEVHYRYQGAVKRYRPDFLVRLITGTTLVLEVKGQTNDEVAAKRAAMEEWCRAVTANGRWGRWVTATSFQPKDVEAILERCVREDAVTPRERFEALVAQWRHATGGWSNPHKIVAHPCYRAIVAMGWEAVPLVLDDLTRNPDPDFWGPALREITGETVTLAPEQSGRLDAVARAWLSLAEKRGWLAAKSRAA
jgi:type III restriction enzyme